MIPNSTIIARLALLGANYTVEEAQNVDPVYRDVTTEIYVYVASSGISSKNPNAPIEQDIYNQHGEDLIQSFDIGINCSITNLHTAWRTIYNQLIGWYPYTLPANITGFTYAEGAKMGLVDGSIFWIDRWRIGFPTTQVPLF